MPGLSAYVYKRDIFVGVFRAITEGFISIGRFIVL